MPGDRAGDTGPAGTVVLVRNLPALQASQADQGQHAHAPSGKSDAAAAASSLSLPRAGRHPNNLGILLSRPCTQPLPQVTQVKLLRARVGKAADCVRTRRAKSETRAQRERAVPTDAARW